MAEHDQDESIREIDESDAGVLATLNKSEIDIQIQTAKRYPRSVTKFHQDAMTLATLDSETARSMFYRLPRDGKSVEGPTIRFAEIMGSCWGNLHYGGRVVAEDDRFLSAQGVAWDLEKNVRANIEVRRRITNRAGKRYSDDMIVTTSNAAIAIALRNAIFKVIPVALTKSIMDAAKECSLGKGLTMEQRRDNAFTYFGKLGAKQEEVLAVLGRSGRDDINVEDLISLAGMRTAIEDGDITWPQILEEATRADEPQQRQAKPASELLREMEAASKTDEKHADGREVSEGDRLTAAIINAPQSQAEPSAGGATSEASTPPADAKEPASGAPPHQESGDIDPQLPSDPISPEQQAALSTAIGKARLGPSQVKAIRARYHLPDNDQWMGRVTVGQFTEIMAAVAEMVAKKSTT